MTILHNANHMNNNQKLSKAAQPLGVFDSGVGGLSVYRQIKSLFPAEKVIYVADQAHVPYGPRPKKEVLAYAKGIVDFLLEKKAKLVVAACNTASAAALQDLRAQFPEVPFVGMEPAVKPAAEKTASGVVGVLATPATFQGDLYASTVERYASGVTILQDTCPGLVAEIERGRIDSPRIRQILQQALEPMLKAGVDEIVLGCTHYPFVIPVIEEILEPDIQVIDPAPAVARQVGRLLELNDFAAEPTRRVEDEFYTSGDPEKMGELVSKLVGIQPDVKQLVWKSGQLHEPAGQE